MKTVEQFLKEVSPFGTLTVGNPKFVEALKSFVDQPIQEGKTPEQMEEINHADLKELAHYYGGWKQLREVIDMLEDNDNAAAYDRQFEDIENFTTPSERAKQMHRIQRDLK